MHIGPDEKITACSTCKGKTGNTPSSEQTRNPIQIEKLLAIEQAQLVETAIDRIDYATDTMFACLGHELTTVDEPFLLILGGLPSQKGNVLSSNSLIRF